MYKETITIKEPDGTTQTVELSTEQWATIKIGHQYFLIKFEADTPKGEKQSE